ILLEVSDAVRESLIAAMDSRELVAAAEMLEADEIADIAPDLPPSVIEEVVQSLPLEERERLRAALSYPEGSIGALMDFAHVSVRDDVTLEAVTRYLRRLDELPDHTDQLFVIDRDQVLKGVLPLPRLLVTDLDVIVPSVAGIGGNSGNQTITMIVRALALSQIQGTWRQLLVKELGVALLNGAVWGTLLGAIAFAFYGNIALAGVMALAMMLNLLLAA